MNGFSCHAGTKVIISPGDNRDEQLGFQAKKKKKKRHQGHWEAVLMKARVIISIKTETQEIQQVGLQEPRIE
jgi:hypothetical protein